MPLQIDCTISPDKKHVNKYNFFASMPDTEPLGNEASDAVKTSIGLCLRETTKREMSCVAFSISNPTGKTYPAEYAKILVQTVKEFLESKTCSTELQRVVFCAKDELHTNAFIQVLECAFGQKTIRVSASNISDMMESVCPPRITQPTGNINITLTQERATYISINFKAV